MRASLKSEKRLVAGNHIRVGVDIGGTFTDLIATSEDDRIWKIKVLTTPLDPSEGVLSAIRRLLDQRDVRTNSIKVLIHATTLASNALLTGNIARTALITTNGFRDVLEIGRQNRPELYNLQVERLSPLVPRRYRFEVRERTEYDGSILEPLNKLDAVNVARKIGNLGIRTVAICLLHSYANPSHEKELAGIVRKENPHARLSLSSELLPEFREYERTSTTVVNAALQPLFSEYLKRIERGLQELGIQAPLFAMQSNGGIIQSSQASLEPARLIESGPVAGAVASRFYSGKSKTVISLDVGGTTSKAGVWSGQGFEVSSEYEVGGRFHGTRRVEGSGYPVRFPVVDLVEVGVGGGSIAWTDAAHVLHVGPQSAGALPGPACYDKGGLLPTLTDACLVLGRLSPSFLLGGDLPLNKQLAFRAITDKLVKPLGMNAIQVAIGVLKISITRIAEALRTATVERGLDPRTMDLVAFGGAGPMFACEVAKELGIAKVVIPPNAGLLSSLGLLLAEPLYDSVRTVLRDAGSASSQEIERVFRRIEARARHLLYSQGVSERDIRYQRFGDFRYQGQSYELSVPLHPDLVSKQIIQRAIRDFHKMHYAKYGYSQPDKPVQLVNVRSYVRGRGGRVGTSPPATVEREKMLPSKRTVWFAGGESSECRVFLRETLRSGKKGRGPCVIEDYDSTLIVSPGARYIVDQNGAISVSI